MKFTLSWLKDHLQTDAGLEAICEALTDIGFEVEGIDDPASEMGAFTVCHVLAAEPHPDADRLRVCLVEIWPDGPGGDSSRVSVVCGAPNARAGMIGVFAPVGVRIPGTGLLLGKSSIRGVESNGMLCSERELKISDEHDGIIDLPADAPLGERFIDYRGMDDPAVEIAVTPNRPDGLGVRGIARDLAARGLGTMVPSVAAPVEGQFPCPVSITIDPSAAGEGCPAFFGRVIRGADNCQSPDWLQGRLRAIGLRPISAVVDITNYVTFDRNRPLHAFDVDKLCGGLRIHPASGGETILALDGTEYRMESGMMLISDDNGPESIAGIMGGLGTGCTGETVNVFLESALWDPVLTATNGRKLKINSDARYRFERGVDPQFAEEGLELATRMILDICGGEASDIGHDGSASLSPRRYDLRVGRTAALVGMAVETGEQLRILSALGFSPTLNGEIIETVVPSWRPDIGGEADLVEEIARIASLARLEGKPLPRIGQQVSDPILTPVQKRERMARRTIAALGYHECVTYSFADRELAAMCAGDQKLVELENPISSELDVMRPDLLPGLLRAVARNQSRGAGGLSLFEVGPVFFGGEPGQQSMQAAGVIAGAATGRNPHGPARGADLYDAKADCQSVMAAIRGPGNLKFSTDAPGWWHPGRSGSAFVRPGMTLATFGELHPRILEAAGVRGRAVAFTVFLDEVPMPRSRGRTRPALLVSDLQAVERDFAFVVGEEVMAADLVRAVYRSRFRKIIESVEIFDEYAGKDAEKQLGAGSKSLAVGVRIQPVKATLREAELDEICSDITARVAEATGGRLRG